MQNEFVKLNIESKIATIIFYHPKSNSLPSNLLKELKEYFDNLSLNPDVNVIVLQSEGEKTFCAGASFDELIEIDNFIDGKEFFMGFARLLNSIRKCKKIVVGKIIGKVVGGGVGLVSVCDYTFATQDSSLKLSELALGLGPFVVGPPIERKIGKEAFVEMSLDCEWRSADWAKQHGFYNEIFDSEIELNEKLNEFTKQLSERSSEALTQLKEIYWEGTDHWDELLEQRAENSGKLVLSDYTKNFIKDFKSKK
ncbi:MAG: enoyl-CoA hydratase/isomerase family protein [Ignavibacteriales bacterium]|nr:enoyl-CoA hydratase/isomerase family protein [Ignavibacteriales bacterium]MCB9258472.1 enoyl-CoA hydratase/isomerase family protein [Ignavibacteriales bacterium]